MRARLAFALRVLLRGVPRPRRGGPEADTAHAECVLADGNPMRSEQAQAAVRDVAMSLLDDDTAGFVVLRVVEADGRAEEVDLTAFLDDGLWPAINATLAHLATVGAEHVGR